MRIKYELQKIRDQSLQRLPQTSGLLMKKSLQKNESLLKPEGEFSAMEFEDGEYSPGTFLQGSYSQNVMQMFMGY